MKFTRLTASFLAFIMLFASFVTVVSAKEEVKNTPEIDSGNAIVAYCIDNDQFLYSDRLDEKVAPTVAAKLVAAMVVSDIIKERGLNSAELKVTVTNTAIDNSGDIADVRVPMMGFRAGNVYTAKDLLSASLVACANDAVASLACHFGEKYLGGSIVDFVNRMNQKVADLGLTSTNFTNPTGLDSPNQYSTPREVALIAAAFYKYDELVKLADVESFFFNGSSTVRNKNYLKSNYYVDGFLNKDAIGLIAGQLDRKGNYCLISASQKEGLTYIFVVMCASGMIVERVEDKTTYSFGEGNAYVDMNKLINWTRSSFKRCQLASADTIVGELRVNAGGNSYVMVVPAENVEKLILNTSDGVLETVVKYDAERVYKKEIEGVEYDTVDAPISRGDTVGTVEFYYNGAFLASADAVAKEAVDQDRVKSGIENIKGFLFGKVMKTLLIILGVFIGLYVLVAVGSAVWRLINKNDKGSKTKNSKNKKAKKAKSSKPKITEQDENAITRERF